eukprot:14006294-Heterocapsa_arctica.AAC.1
MDLDGLGCEYLEAPYFDGHSHDCGAKRLAAIGKFAWPRISLLLSPFESGIPGKTQEFDESVL